MSGPKLPGLPSWSDVVLDMSKLALPPPPRPESDGTKRVTYRPVVSRNERPTSSKKKMGDLPIMPHAQAILQLILKKQVVALDSPTGTGKTRYIPYYVAKETNQKVRVAIPTTVAVRDAYNFISEYTDMSVGFAAQREIKYSVSTQLVYGTTGHFTQKIITLYKSYGKITPDLRKSVKVITGDIFFIDEVHTSTVDITLLIGLLNYIFRNPNGTFEGPKIIFSTATFNSVDISDFFSEFPIYKITLQAYPVEMIFMEKDFNPKSGDVDSEILKIIRKEYEDWTKNAGNYHGIVFRPGVNEVEISIDFLERAFNNDPNIEFYPAYSRLDPKELDEIFKPSKKMKIIIGTNVIESSITVPDVEFIINDMLVKTPETSSAGGNRLTLNYVTKAESNQRKGRTGRTRPGRAYYLCNQEFYFRLPDFREKEIDRIPIYNIVLQLFDAGMNVRSVLRISEQRYEQARTTLLELGMIERKDNTYTVTEAGKFSSLISLSIQNSYLIYLGYQDFVKDPTGPTNQLIMRTIIAVACMLEVYEPGFFYVPRRDKGETEYEYIARRDAYIEKYHDVFRGETDIHTLVNIFWGMMDFIRVARSYDRSVRGNFYDYVKNFSIDKSMNNKKLREMLIVLRDIEQTVTELVKSPSPIDLTTVYPEGGYEALGNLSARLFAKAYFGNTLVREVNPKGHIYYLNPKTGVKYRIGTRNSFNKIRITNLEGPGKVIAAETIEVLGKNGITNIASLIVDETYI